MHPPLLLVYFQLNTDGTSFYLEQSCFELYTTADPADRATWYTRVAPGQVRRRWNQSVRIRVICEGGNPGDVLCLDIPAVLDHIISDIMDGLVEINRNFGHENLVEFQEAAI